MGLQFAVDRGYITETHGLNDFLKREHHATEFLITEANVLE